MIPLRDEYVARFGAVAGVTDCRAADRELDLEELKRVSAKRAPSVWVTCVGMDGLEELDALVGRFRWAAVVLAKAGSAKRESRDSAGDVAAAIAQLIAHELVCADGFAEGRGRAEDVELGNVGSTAMHRQGYSAWAVAWMQPAELIAPDAPVLADLHIIATDFDTTGAGGEPDGTPETSSHVDFT